MTVLQCAIGALNDLVDAPADVGRVPPKPIPSGVVSVGEARAVALVAAIAGLVIASTVGVVAIGLVVLAIGASYDLIAKGTPWSWLPFAVGIPILPVYGWFGATGALPPFFAVLLPMAMLAGAALAIANARADLESDLASGTASVATRLGSARSWWVGAALMAAATGIGLLFVGRSAWGAVTVALIAVGTGLIVIGVIAGRGSGQPARRRAWEAQAVGAAVAATGWVAAMTRLTL
jgi:4-hydroxybenzoate polyprenyltransferase